MSAYRTGNKLTGNEVSPKHLDAAQGRATDTVPRWVADASKTLAITANRFNV
jgi:hypothetical protein